MPTARLSLFALAILFAFSASAAPHLSEDNRQRLEEETSDRDALLDQQDGLYVLLRNAARWQADDFTDNQGPDGEAAEPAPAADYDAIFDDPAAARGNVYLIEGWLAQHDRFPTKENHERDRLYNTLDATWGDQVTRWTIVTEMDNPDATVIVLFWDPNARIDAPAVESKVRVAARFYKLWTIDNADGTPHTYAVFVGGASQVTEAPGTDSSGGGPSTRGILISGLVGAAIVVFLIRRMAQKKAVGGSMVQHRLEQMRREREEIEEDELEEEEAEDLPEDPVEALDALRKKHESEE